MKKILAILFLSVYLISTTELYQLLKLPILIEHYLDHKEKNKEITLFAFLSYHYNGNHLDHDAKNDDYDQDRKLPFASHTELLTVNIVVSSPLYFFLKTAVPTSKKTKLLILNDSQGDSNFLCSIWQPPKSFS